MLGSARVGLAAAVRARPSAILVLPVDHPEVRGATVASLGAMMAEAMRIVRQGAAARDFAYALVPRHRGRRGHPLVLSPALARAIVKDNEARRPRRRGAAQCPAGRLPRRGRQGRPRQPQHEEALTAGGARRAGCAHACAGAGAPPRPVHQSPSARTSSASGVRHAPRHGPSTHSPVSGTVARAVVHADERVGRAVEEVRVAEVERQRLVPAGVDPRVDDAAPADDERVAPHAVEHDREPRAARPRAARRRRRARVRRRRSRRAPRSPDPAHGPGPPGARCRSSISASSTPGEPEHESAAGGRRQRGVAERHGDDALLRRRVRTRRRRRRPCGSHASRLSPPSMGSNSSTSAACCATACSSAARRAA